MAKQHPLNHLRDEPWPKPGDKPDPTYSKERYDALEAKGIPFYMSPKHRRQYIIDQANEQS